MASILKVDKIRGTGLDSDTMSFDGSGNITMPKNVTFNGTVTGDNASIVKVASSSATVTGLSSLEIDLPTTTDFLALKLIIRGLKCNSVAGNNHWRWRFRQQGGSIITSNSYNYIMSHNYTNDTDHGAVYHHDLNTDNLSFGGNVGDGTDDSEMTSMEFDIHNNATSGRYTRGFARKSIEKRHNDTYHYANDGSWSVASSSVLDRIEIAVQNSTAFTSYGYALYKVLF